MWPLTDCEGGAIECVFLFFLTTTCSSVFYLTRVYEDRVLHWRNTQRRFVCATIRQPTTEAWWMTFNKRSHSTVNNFKLNINLLLKHNFVRFGTGTVENFYLNQVSLLWFWTIPDIPLFNRFKRKMGWLFSNVSYPLTSETSLNLTTAFSTSFHLLCRRCAGEDIKSPHPWQQVQYKWNDWMRVERRCYWSHERECISE